MFGFGKPNLTKMGNEGDYDSIREALNHKNKKVQEDAMAILANHAMMGYGGNKPFTIMIDSLLNHENPEVRKFAAFSLELQYKWKSEPSIIDAFIHALGDRDDMVFSEVHRFLMENGNPQVIEVTRQALRDRPFKKNTV